MFGGDKAKAKRCDDLRSEVAQLELSVGAARSEYTKIAAINRDELARFAKDRRADYGVMVENFAATQVTGVTPACRDGPRVLCKSSSPRRGAAPSLTALTIQPPLPALLPSSPLAGGGV